jgi:hypothetical protein
VDPRVNYNDTSKYSYWMEYKGSLDGCTPTGAYDFPSYNCTVTLQSIQHQYQNDNNPIVYAPWKQSFRVDMICGPELGTVYIKSKDSCTRYKSAEKTPCECDADNPGVGNPITPLDGIKHQKEDIFSWGRGHRFHVSYNYLRESVGQSLVADMPPAIGSVWFSNLHKVSISSQTPGNEGLTLYLRPNGSWKTFFSSGSRRYGATEFDRNPIYSGSAYLYSDTSAGSIESYVSVSYPLSVVSSISYIDGRKLSLTRANVNVGGKTMAVLKTISDESGRSVNFEYEALPNLPWSARLSSAKDPAGNVFSFQYGPQNQLTTIRYPDETMREYRYEVSGRPWLITALIDEGGAVFGRYGYDDQGRANWTKTGTDGEEWSVQWTQPPAINATVTATGDFVYRNLSFQTPSAAKVTGTGGYEATMSSNQIDGVTFIASKEQPAGQGLSPVLLQFERDAAGNITREVDANGLQSCRTFLAERRLESSRIEGLSATVSCSAVAGNAPSLPSLARKVSTEWHPVWRKQVRVAQPNLITTFVYNGQPDPTKGNAVASCAPTTAKLPDGSSIVVLCKRVEQATTDPNGAQGFNAVAQTGVPARVWTWTYDRCLSR